MADEKRATHEGEDELRDVTRRLEDEQRAWNGDLEASNRREIDERYNDARGDRSSLAWGAGGMQREDRTDSVTSVLSEEGSATADRSKTDRSSEEERSGERGERDEKLRGESDPEVS